MVSALGEERNAGDHAGVETVKAGAAYQIVNIRLDGQLTTLDFRNPFP
jgi:hypothetical protein